MRTPGTPSQPPDGSRVARRGVDLLGFLRATPTGEYVATPTPPHGFTFEVAALAHVPALGTAAAAGSASFGPSASRSPWGAPKGAEDHDPFGDAEEWDVLFVGGGP